MIQEVARRLRSNIGQVIKGKEKEIDKLIMALLCEGHILLEDIPGTGKTTVAKALAKSLGCSFKRVQFTPDLLPTDLIGVNFYNQKQEDFVFKPGPVFTQILLADEINRATPRTQSSLLECMEEGQVTIDGETYILEKPFLVIATQNPIETQGTFPLPEAQLDRFFMRMSMGYPEKEDEIAILNNQQEKSPLEDLSEVVSSETLREVQVLARQVKVSNEVKGYIIDLARATREETRFKLGISLRGSLAIMKAAQAYASMQGRNYVIPDDVKAVIKDVVVHRIIYKGYNLSNNTALIEEVIDEILKKVSVPVE